MLNLWKLLFSIILFLGIGCASPIPTTPQSELQKDFIAISGVIEEVKKEDGFDRVFVRLKGHSGEDILAVAYNDDNFSVLVHVFNSIDVGSVVVLYGVKIDEPWQDIYYGLDIEIMAIEYELMGRSIIVDTKHGDRVKDQLEMKNIFKFIGNVGGKAVKSAL